MAVLSAMRTSAGRIRLWWHVVRFAARNDRIQREWLRKGRPVPPPPSVKHSIIKRYAFRFGTRVLVETGTFMGDTVCVCLRVFRRIFSIELDEALFERAKNRFIAVDNIAILHGDSGEVLPRLLSQIDEPCLFWLDAHYSGTDTALGAAETPIAQELQHILTHPVADHVILIDDAHEFVGENDYPALEEIRRFILERRPGWVVEVRQNVIRAHRRA